MHNLISSNAALVVCEEGPQTQGTHGGSSPGWCISHAGCFSVVKPQDRNLLATSNMQVECVDKARRDFLLVSSGGDL